jgi:hypothetical protein
MDDWLLAKKQIDAALSGEYVVPRILMPATAAHDSGSECAQRFKR